MKLHKLKISDISTRAQCKCNTITRGNIRIRGLQEDLPETTRGKDNTRCQGCADAAPLPGANHVQGHPLRRSGFIQEEVKYKGILDDVDALISGNGCD
jgi:hypothetical protein